MAEKTKTRDEFIEENLRLVHSLCHRFAGRGIEYDDLYQAGCMGLVKAADAFEPERGLMFSTYAVPVVMGEMRRLFRDGGAVKVSRGIKELGYKISRASESLRSKLGREPTVNELAEYLGTSPEQIAEAVCASQPTVSLTHDDDGATSEFDLPDESDEEIINDRIMLDTAIKKLDDTEQKIILCRYYNYLTQSETAHILSMSQVQISRAEKKILKKLRGIIELGA